MKTNVTLTVWLAAIASLALAAPASAQTLAFPEAEGFGRFATGARTSLASATVYHVTNLNDSGTGSLRDALSAANRFVVFDVGGIINLSSVVTVASNITIAGQTAPGGIQVWNNRVAFHGANNLNSRYWGVRLGRSQGREDAASIVRGQNMMFDHMSITWGVDGTFDINPDSGQIIDDLTIQNSIIGQGLDSVGHSTGGLMTIGTGNQFSIIKSLLIDNATRNPKARGENEFINNVVYGWEQGGYLMGDTGAVSNANAEGNYFIYGVGNRIDHTGAAININPSAPFSSGSASFSIYGNDNWVDGNRDGVLNGTPITSYPGSTVLGSRIASFPTTTTMTAQQAVQFVRDNVGMSITRDAVDSRLVQEVASYGTLGSVILRETDVFPNYPTDASYLRSRARLADTDNDGMPDNWETSRGLNPNSNSTGEWRAVMPSGYVRLEEYFNELGGYNVTRSASAGGAWTTAATWGGTLPDFATTAVATGGFTHASGNAFARQLSTDGASSVSGGTLDVFDTLKVGSTGAASLAVSDGAAVHAGQVFVSSPGFSGSLSVTNATLQTGTIASGGGAASMALDGATLRFTGAPKVSVPIALGAGGVTVETKGIDGEIFSSIIGAGGLTKNGAGRLKLSGANSFGSPIAVNVGTLAIANANSLGATPQLFLAAGTTLDATAPGTVTALLNQTFRGAGAVQGNFIGAGGSTVFPTGGTFVVQGRMVGVQAEAMTRGSDWAIFNAATHGSGNGGSYGGAGLSGDGVVLVSGESLTQPTANGGLTTTVNIPTAGTWKLFVRIVEPTLSAVPGDPSTAAGGNNSFYTSNVANSLQTTVGSGQAVQTNTSSSANLSHWSVVSATTPLSGVVGSPSTAGIDFNLTAGSKTFSIYGREVGTILDGFVLSNINLTAAQLDSALAGQTVLGTTFSFSVTGNFTQQASSTLRFDIGAGTFSDTVQVGGAASLAGQLLLNVGAGVTPAPSAQFTLLTAASVAGTFAGAPNGARVLTSGGGSFQVNYASTNVKLSNYLPPLSADFDHDGFVDGDDLAIWSTAMTDSTLAGDADSDGQTNGDDFLLWQQQLGSTVLAVPAVAVVPEPTGLALLVGTAIGLSAVRRRVRR